MKRINRRGFLKWAGALGGSAVLGGNCLAGSAEGASSDEQMGMLVDTTLCGGCRACEEACNEANELPKPEVPFYEESVFEKERDTTPEAFAVINRYENPKDKDSPVFRRRQCMHCDKPACASACLVKAMQKKANGPVIWEGKNCIGCRYCMISCPFDVPKFEYDSTNPRVMKCNFCYQRQLDGQLPACAETCPNEAILFGKRGELIDEAKSRIYKNPDDYVHSVYGEHEVGGTGWRYLSSLPFGQIGLRTDLGNRPLPELSGDFLHRVSHILVLWPAFLLGLYYVTAGKDKGGE